MQGNTELGPPDVLSVEAWWEGETDKGVRIGNYPEIMSLGTRNMCLMHTQQGGERELL